MSSNRSRLTEMERSALSILVTAEDLGKKELSVRDIGQAIYGAPPGANSAEYFRIRTATESLVEQQLITKSIRTVNMGSYSPSRVSFFRSTREGRRRLSSEPAEPHQTTPEALQRDPPETDPACRAPGGALEGGALADPPDLAAARRRLLAGCTSFPTDSRGSSRTHVSQLVKLANQAWTDGHWSEKYPIVRFPVKWVPTQHDIDQMVSFLADVGIAVTATAWNANRGEVRLLVVN